jgi:non-ribosomal peptide synthetase component F
MMENNNASKLSSLSKEQLQLLLKKRAEKGLQDKNVLSKMPRNRENIYPLSSAQQRFWFLDQLDENHILYNNPIYGLLTFKEPLRTDLIERTIKEIIHRHDIFRTAFVCKNGVPYQKIEETVPFHLEFEDVRALPDEDKDTYVAESAKREATQQIPLDKAPLFRFRYIQLSDSKYLFLYTPHHIISDGWSNGQFLRELVMLYNSFRTSGINNLSLPEYQFIDYVAWEQQWMGSDSYKASVDYWKNTLLPLPENLKLPVDKKRPVMLSGKGKLITLPLSEKLTKEIHAYCQQENVTPFNFFLAALNVLLYRYSQQSEIIIGVPVANREEREFQEISGLFLNTLPYKTPIHSQQSFRNILLQIKEQSYNNLKRQKLPFDKLLSELKVERNLQSTPLFQVLFVFQNIPSLYSNANISIEPYKQDLGTTKYDLNFWIEEYNGKFVITLTANTELFSNGMIERILQHYSRLVQELLVAPLLPVSTVRFMTADEQSMSFGTKSVQQPDANVKDLIEAAVRCHPEEVALEFEDKQLTYNQLNCQANRLANLLIEKNVNKHPVVILLNRGMEMIVALTATIKSGVPSIPIDAKLPLERIKYIIEDSKANLVISHSQLNEKSRILSADIIVMDEQQAEIERYSDVNPAVKMTSDDLVYIIYTSGTTGASKGVCIPHKSLVNYIRAIIDRLGFKSGKRYVTVSTLSADLGNTMIYPSLVNGGKLLITNDEEMISPDLLANRFRKTLPDYLKIVP